MFESVIETNGLLKNKKIKLTDVVSYFLGEIKKENGRLNAFLEVFEDEALEEAKSIQQKIDENRAGKLAGAIVGLKDNIVYKGHKSTACSKMLENFESLFNATVVDRLLKEDAIIIGRLNCDEFAMGSANETSYFGNANNPYDVSLTPGGSSGGSAAAVASSMCNVALGSDTGGSIRQPASFTGIVGLKPTYGRVSRYGLIAYASSFDQIGLLTKDVMSNAFVLSVIAGKDKMDATSSSRIVENYENISSVVPSEIKIAYIEDIVSHSSISVEVRKGFEQMISTLKMLGFNVKPISFPYIDYLVPAYYVLTTAEASSNLARYDGVHFGYRSPNAYDMESVYVKSRSEGFGLEVKRRIMTGTFVLSAGYIDQYYGKGQKVRRIIAEATKEIFSNFDFILTPTTPHVAFKHGSKGENPIEMYLEDIYTVHANLVGIPAISLPLFKNNQGLPFGMQLMADKFEEKKLFDISYFLEKEFEKK